MVGQFLKNYYLICNKEIRDALLNLLPLNAFLADNFPSSVACILSSASTLLDPITDPETHHPTAPAPCHIFAKVLIMRSCSQSFRCSSVAVFLIMIAFIIYSARQRNYMPELAQNSGERAADHGLRMRGPGPGPIPIPKPIPIRGQERNPYLTGIDRFGRVH